MIKHRCYWCRKYATEDVLIRRDGFGFCCSECVIEFVNNGCQPKERGKTEANEVYHGYIEATLATAGVIKREDLARVFGLSLPTATRNFSDFRRMRPGVMEFEPSDKTYRRGCNFTTQILDHRGVNPSEFLSAIRTVFGNS